MLALYGHPFSSYTWKAQIALYANGTAFEPRMVSPEHPDNAAFVAEHGGPWAKFPVLADGERVIFEATSIIEYLALHHPGEHRLLPEDADTAAATRMFDRVFDLYVMTPMQALVNEHIRSPGHPDEARCAEAGEQLEESYRWLERWLETYPVTDEISLIECAAAPALFYADWVHPLESRFPRLAAWRAHLLALPAVSRCVEEARPFRPLFPSGAPDRD